VIQWYSMSNVLPFVFWPKTTSIRVNICCSWPIYHAKQNYSGISLYILLSVSCKITAFWWNILFFFLD
jgi:hypothetical protein